MEPVAAFALACGVIQVVDFGLKTLSRSRELYKIGSLAENDDAEQFARYHTKLREQLEALAKNPHPQTDNPAFHDEGVLLRLANECSKTADSLTAELESLKIQQSSHRKHHALVKSIKSRLKKGSIDSLQRKLEHYQKMIDTQIIVSLRQQLSSASLQQIHHFNQHQEEVRNVAIALTQRQNDFRSLADIIEQGNASVKQQVAEGLENLKMSDREEKYEKRFLESLYFPEIHLRQETVAEAHVSTFEWIFKTDFVEWLEQEGSIYWIRGKAGSGKSTLMNHIYNHSRTLDALRKWSCGEPFITPAFFFWNPGSEMQKSSLGLLRSLLFQILQDFPDLTRAVASKIRLMTKFRDRVLFSDSISKWTQRRLLSTLQLIFRDRMIPCRVCFFIDGLDEFTGKYDALVELIQEIVHFQGVKICVSSRPYRAFSDFLGSYPKLKLEELTKGDISAYVSSRLSSCTETRELESESPQWISETVERVVGKAAGVFLWVRLAVDDQLEGVRNGDTPQQLAARLEILPDELEELFVHMLKKIGKADRREAACFLQCVLEDDLWSLPEQSVLPTTVLSLALAQYPRIDELLRFSPEITNKEIQAYRKRTARRINTICWGFLETRIWPPDRSLDSGDEAEYKDELQWTSGFPVQVIHRTVSSFFRENEEARIFLRKYGLEQQELHQSFIKVSLGMMILWNMSGYGEDLLTDTLRNAPRETTLDPEPYQRHVTYIMNLAAALESKIENVDMAFMNMIDSTLSELYGRFNRRIPSVHWSVQWRENSTSIEVSSGHYMTDSTHEPYFERGAGNTTPRYRKGSMPTPIPERPIDFLGLASYSGLSIYVRQRLSTIQCQDPGALTYLLHCALAGLHLTGDLDLVYFLLGEGADPNMAGASATPWELMLYRIRDGMENKERAPYSGLNKIFKILSWAIAIKTFLRSGANVHQILESMESTIQDRSGNDFICRAIKMEGPPFPPLEDYPEPVELYTICKYSVLILIQELSDEADDLGEIKNILIEKGARSESWICGLMFDYSNDDFSKRVVLSKEQSDELVGAFIREGRTPFSRCIERCMRVLEDSQ
ncbi:hypothetical protein ACLMJK_009152 [Lecanora helva]